MYYPPMANLLSEKSEAMDPCPRCGAKVPRLFVHGHYQCQQCHSNIDDCCQGEVCENSYWRWENDKGKGPNEGKGESGTET